MAANTDQVSPQAKIREYRNFVDNVLRPQLLQAKSSKQNALQEIDEYKDLLKTLQKAHLAREDQQRIDQSLQVDLGHGKVFCEAQRQLDSTLFIHVGMGFHVEFTVVEGIEFIGRRLQHLDRVLQPRQAKLKQIEEHVASSEFILTELARTLDTGRYPS